MKSWYGKLQLAAIFLGLGVLAQGCGEPVLKDDPGHPGSHPNAITLTRKYQHVMRYNCDGSLRDNDIESIQEPTEWRSLSPDGGRYADALNLRNRQNGDTANPTTESNGGIAFLIKYNTGEGGLKVDRGLNIVDYNFTANSSPVESGTVSFDITYVEETEPGTLVQHITCPSPTPSN